MATFSSSTASIVLLFLLSAVVVAPAAGVVQEKVKAACDGTPHPETCSIVLSPSANESNTADECALALLAAERGSDLLSQVDKKIIAVSDEIINNDKGRSELPEYVPCLSACAFKMGDASLALGGEDAFDSSNDKKVTISDLRRYVADAKAKHLVWSCDECRSLGNKKVEELAKGSTVENFMEVLYVLVDRVPAGKEC